MPSKLSFGLHFANDMYSWLEDFNLGFDRNKIKETAREKHLPIINEKGMCWWYSLAHGDFVWKMRAEVGVVGAFEKVYNTPDLVVSFDALNFTFSDRDDIQPNKTLATSGSEPRYTRILLLARLGQSAAEWARGWWLDRMQGWTPLV